MPPDARTSLWSWQFWKAAVERAIRTAAQTAAASIAADVVVGDPFIDWQYVGALALLGAILSILTSVGTGVVSEGPGFTETPKPSSRGRLNGVPTTDKPPHTG